MSELDVQRIFKRLEGLEKQNRNMKVAFSLVTLFILTGLFSWAMLGGVQKVHAEEAGEVIKKEFIRSEGFILVDSDGTRRARLVMEAGIPSLTFLSADGKVIGRLAVGKRPEYVRSWPEEKRERLVPPSGLFLYDTEGVPRTTVQIRNGLRVYDHKGQLGACMSERYARVYDGEKVASMKGDSIGFFEGEWKKRVELNMNNGLRLFNSDGKGTVSLQPCDGLSLYDSKGSSSVTLQPWIGLRLHGTERSGLRLLSVSFYDDAKRRRLRLDGDNGLVWYDAHGNPKIQSNPDQTNNQ